MKREYARFCVEIDVTGKPELQVKAAESACFTAVVATLVRFHLPPPVFYRRPEPPPAPSGAASKVTA